MYYQGSSEIQGDGLQTLYLMNPNFTGGGYSDAQPPPAGANMVILNYSSGNPVNLASMSSGGQQAQTHLVGVPLQASVAGAAVGSNNSHDLKLNHLSMHSQHEVPASASRGSIIPHFHHSLWGSLDQTGGGGSPSHHHHHHHIPSGVVVGNNPGDVGTQLGFHRPVLSPTQQGLSLTLSSSQQPGCRSSTLAMDQNISVQNPVGILSPRSAGENLRGLSGSSSSVSAVSNGIPGLQSAVFGSKYLKAAQQLLDDLVNVGQGSKNDSMEKGKEKGKVNGESTVLTAGEASQIGQIDTKDVTELTAAQRQEIQMKKAKLVSMLDEVEQRYRQYHHQMQIVVASFEQAAGIGSAKSYTQLALQTISKQFRCLKDAISTQIKSASKSLGEEESSLGGKFEGSRLKFVDQQLRQQRALQQLGMMQNNTWRPQRGLPERAVSVLRAWLFEHFLHPYPKDSDKQMLAKQTGLTRSQVSNWFINARVRLWKPMVEEMYMEETKNNQEQDGSESNKELGSNSTTPKENNVARNDQRNVLQSKQEKSSIGHDHGSHTDIATSSLATTSPTNTSTQVRAGFGLIGALNMEGNVEKNSKKMRTEMQNSPSSILSVDMDMKFGETRKGLISSQRQTTKDSFSLMVNNTSTTHGSGFGAFTIGELGQFNPDQLTTGFHGNSVSLTLGLPPSENLALSGNHHEQNYLSDQNMELGGRLEMGAMEGHYDRVNKSQTSHSNMGYETINFDNRKRFAAQLLPDFVT